MRELDDLPTPAQGGDGDRTRGPYRRARGWRNHVTESEAKAAVKKFQGSGGTIRVLPPEPDPPPNRMIGWVHGVYESPIDLGLMMRNDTWSDYNEPTDTTPGRS